MCLGDSGIKFPDWYRIERDAEKVSSRLTNVKELTAYLINPDEFIRRIAIRRLGELKLKDSVTILQQIVEDRLENRQNIELAAWSLKSVSHRWGIEFFSLSKTLDSYTGSERYEDLFGARFADFSPSIRIGKNTLPSFPEIKREEFNNKQSADIMPDTQFPVKEWLREFTFGVWTALGRLPAIILKLSVKTVKSMKNLKTVRFKKTERIKKDPYAFGKDWHCSQNYSREWEKRQFNPASCLHSLFVGLLKITTFPFRMLFKYKVPILLSVVSLYIILSATTLGKRTVYKYSGVDLDQLNSTVLGSFSKITSYAFSEARDLAEINPQSEEPNSGAGNRSAGAGQEVRKQENLRTYYVTAKSGLNLRKSPDSSSDKVLGTVLSYKSKVTYLSVSKKDSSGRIWLFVRSPEGKEGWVSSKWLKEVDNG